MPPSRAAEFVQRWETQTKLSPSSLRALHDLHMNLQALPMPDVGANTSATPSNEPGMPSTSSPTSVSTSTSEEDATAASVPSTDIQSMEQFYAWFYALEEEATAENEHQVKMELLKEYSNVCRAVCDDISASLSDLDDIERQHEQVSSKTGRLHRECEELMADQKRLVLFAEALQHNLSVFDDAEKIGGRLKSGAYAVGDADFEGMMNRLDECVHFVTYNDGFKESASALLKFRALQTKALLSVKTQVVGLLTAATTRIVAEAQAEQGNLVVPGSAASEASLYYVKFKTLAPKIKALTIEIEKRSDHAPFKLMLDECQDCYFQQRFALLGDVIRATIDGFVHEARAAKLEAKRQEQAAASGDAEATSAATQESTLKMMESGATDDDLAEDLDLIARNGCAYLIRICELEYQLYRHFFSTVPPIVRNPLLLKNNPSSSHHTTSNHGGTHGKLKSKEKEEEEEEEEDYGQRRRGEGDEHGARMGEAAEASRSGGREEKKAVALPPLMYELMEQFSAPLYETLRSLFIRSHDIDQLCTLAHILNQEILQEQVKPRGNSARAFAPIAKQMLEDVQVRLLFLMQGYVTEYIGGFIPTAKDLEYPEILHSAAARQRQSRTTGDGSGGGKDGVAIFETWYGTLHRTLMCLSKLYLAIDLHIFEGIAQEAVQQCTETLVAASKLISKTKGPLDGLLFLVRHLLILREQITPFDVDFCITEKTLDFSHMKDAIAQIVSRRSGLWALIQHAAPRVLDHRLDSKRDLELALKTTIESFIMLVTRDTIEPLLNFQTSAALFVNTQQKRIGTTTNSSKGTGGSTVEGVKGRLCEQEFARVEVVKGMVENVQHAITGGKLSEILIKTSVYLTNTATQTILFQPIKTNVMESFNRFHALLRRHYTDADVASLHVFGAAELSATLDQAFLDAQQKKLCIPGSPAVPSTKSSSSSSSTEGEVKVGVVGDSVQLGTDSEAVEATTIKEDHANAEKDDPVRKKLDFDS